MKTRSLLVTSALLASSFGAFAQSFTSTASSEVAAGTSPGPAAAANASYYTRNVGKGRITYFGSVCSHEVNHEQFARLRQAFETSRPTVVFFLNPDGGVDSTEVLTINHLGEAGYVRYLAKQHEVPAERLDDPVAEYEYLQTKIDPERLKLFCLLRDIQQFRERTGASQSLTVKAMKALIANSHYFLPGTEGVIRNIAELETAYRKYCPTGGKWSQAPAAWFNPNVAVSSPGSPFLAEVRSAVREYRAANLYGKALARAQAGEHVLVVIDRAALPTQLLPLATK